MALLIPVLYMFFVISLLSAVLFYFFFGRNEKRNKIIAFLSPFCSVGIYLLLLLGIFRSDPLSAVWDCNGDQCMADGMAMLVGYAVGGFVGVFVNGLIGLHWQRQQRIRWGALNTAGCFALLGVLFLLNLGSRPSELDLKNKELARDRRENGTFECVSVNKNFSSQETDVNMQTCLNAIEKFQTSEADKYLAWNNLRQFSSEEGFNYWHARDNSLIFVVPEKMQNQFLKIYFEMWMERESFGRGQDLIDLKSQLKSLAQIRLSTEALQYFLREVAPKIFAKLPSDALSEIEPLMKDIAKISQK